MEADKYTYYRIDFTNCGVEFDYTIVDTLDEVKEWLSSVDTELDDPDANASVKITGVGMTREEFEEFVKSCEE